MKLLLTLAMLLLGAATFAHPLQAPQKPLDKNQILSLVSAGMDSADLAQRVRELGIDFDPSEEFLETLRKAGAQDVLLKALRSGRPKPLNRQQVLGLVAGGVHSERAQSLIKQHGIDFWPDEEYLQTLRVAGADEALLAAVRSAGEAASRVDANPTAGQGVVNPKDGLKYVWIPPGTFTMGCSPGDSECDAGEKPSHAVTLTKGFWLGQTPVTAGAYKRFAQSKGKSMPAEPTPNGQPLNSGWTNDAMPMVSVTWEEARDYCAWAGGRLPTEAEWEYAARGGSTEARYGPLDDIAWYADNSGRKRLDSTQIFARDQARFSDRLVENGNVMHEVGQKRPNRFGLYDVLGNVYQWVSDMYLPEYYQESPSQDPPGPPTGEGRGIRGSTWSSRPRYVRVSARTGLMSPNTTITIGFRCVGRAGT